MASSAILERSHRLRVIAAFATLYVIWGSTYLGMMIAIETIPPFLMAAARFTVAGVILVLWARRRGAPAPTAHQWRTATVIGALLLVGGNGGVVWAETRVASGLTALMIGAEPLWAVLLDWVRPAGKRPPFGVIVGLLTGFAGVALLVAPGDLAGKPVDTLGAAVLVIASITWAMGSIYSRHADTPGDPLMATGINMLAGAAGLWITSTVAGEFGRFDPAAMSARSIWAWVYLTMFGAIAGFSAYIWLLRNVSLAKASTYAYVNPVIAVFLGWLVLDESVTARTVLAAAVIISGVVMISTLPYLARKAG